MKTIFISGSTDGIGKQTALELAHLGHEIIVHGRNKKKGLQVVEYISRQSGNKNIHYLNADFSNLDEIKILSEQIKSRFSNLDVLINNAGVFENMKIILENGFEKTFMVNHIAPFFLSIQLLDLLKDNKASRIVNLSSMAQATSIDFNNMNGEKYFDPYNAYAVSKLCNLLFTYKLDRELAGNSTTANCLHPGVINTKLLRTGWGMGGGSLESGAKTSVYLAEDNGVNDVSGKYFVNSAIKKSVAISYDLKVQNKLWEISEKMVGQNN